jgi:small-conductance mechanosensitive channel
MANIVGRIAIIFGGAMVLWGLFFGGTTVVGAIVYGTGMLICASVDVYPLRRIVCGLVGVFSLAVGILIAYGFPGLLNL